MYKPGGIVWSMGTFEELSTPFLVVNTMPGPIYTGRDTLSSPVYDTIVKLLNLESGEVIDIIDRHLKGLLEDENQVLRYEDPP